MKACTYCHIEKRLSEFYKQVNMVDGHVNECKTCKRAKANKRKREQKPRQADVFRRDPFSRLKEEASNKR